MRYQLSIVKLPNDFVKKRAHIMGGIGSGLWERYYSKQKMDQMLCIDIRNLRKRGMLTTGRYPNLWSWSSGELSFIALFEVVAGKEIIVKFRGEDHSTGVIRNLREMIRITQTGCAYGGYRQWFICPRCCHRMAVVVLQPPTIGCRHCLDLSYASQNEGACYRSLRRRVKIGKRLGISDELSRAISDKPKGMHWETYRRLLNAYDDADTRAEDMFWREHRL